MRDRRKRYQARRAICERKVTFYSIGAATRAKYSLIEKRGERMVTYRCDICSWWHVGHRMPQEAYMRSKRRSRHL